MPVRSTLMLLITMGAVMPGVAQAGGAGIIDRFQNDGYSGDYLQYRYGERLSRPHAYGYRQGYDGCCRPRYYRPGGYLRYRGQGHGSSDSGGVYVIIPSDRHR
jgi:hypothetical protein